MDAELILKEQIADLHFPPVSAGDVLPTSEARNHRMTVLHEALMLGNDFKQKVKIIFATASGKKSVYTTIWAVTDSHIELKAGKDIPIYCIYEIVI